MIRMLRHAAGPAGIIAALTLLAALGPGAAGATPTIGEVAEALRARRAKVTSLLVTYEARGTSIAPREDLLRKGTISMPEEDGTAAFLGRKMYVHKINRIPDYGAMITKLREKHPDLPEAPSPTLLLDRLPASEVLSALDSAPRQSDERTLIFDGELFKETSPGTLSDFGVKRGVEKFYKPKPQKYRFLPETFLDMAGIGLDDPCGGEAAEVGLLERVVARPEAKVEPATADVNGSPCVVVRIGDSEAMWLDPALGYAPRRRERSYRGKLILELECDRYEEKVSGFWFPRTIIRYPHVDGKRFMRLVSQAVKVEANRPEHAALFDMDPKPGSFVINETLPPVDAAGAPLPMPEGSGVPGVTYIQPRDKAEVSRVILDAQRAYGEAASQEQGRWKRNRLLITWSAATGGILLVIAALRWYRAKMSTSNGRK